MSRNHSRRVAYFSMEIALSPDIPTYSGGLGMLAGDTIRSAADLQIPMVAVTLLHRQGYFFQRLSDDGWQSEEPNLWDVDEWLTELPQRVSVTIEGRAVELRAWQFDVTGRSGFKVPVYLLDADLPQNNDKDRSLTGQLYGGDQRYRLCQEVLLGIGGVRMLRALEHTGIRQFHMNEGHAALLTLELLQERIAAAEHTIPTSDDIEAVHDQCVFTTHTPVPAGHDQFSMDLVRSVLGDHPVYHTQDVICCEGLLNMTFLAMNLSHYINGVAKRHGEVSRHMFAQYQIDSITNGVHAATWVCPEMAELFDRKIGGWREDNFSLRYALGISSDDLRDAHHKARQTLVHELNRTLNAGLEDDAFTIGFARRSTAYKRPDLLLSDLDRLSDIAKKHGPLQVVYAGKAHPRDQQGKQLIHHIFEARRALKDVVNIVFVPNYDMKLGQLLTSGVDLWLNTPEPPMEASGTSGMKAAVNGVPSLSILDGWWIEGCIEGVTGWAIGVDGHEHRESSREQDAASLYEKLDKKILPLFHNGNGDYVDMMKHAIALNGSFFNTQRMMQQYVLKAYLYG